MRYHDKSSWHELPPKRVLVIFVEMGQYQQSVYDEVCKRTDSRAGDDRKKAASHSQLVDRFAHAEGTSGVFTSLCF